jgi:hypothetical protein
MEGQILQIITVAGAAGAFFLVLKWIVDGKLHSDSETKGLREDKTELLKINADQSVARAKSNELLSKALDGLQQLREELDLSEKELSVSEKRQGRSR